MKKYIIKEEDAQALLNYLQAKPYAEVHKGVEVLTNLEEVEDAEDDE